MQLPFTGEQFFDVFAAHNATFWRGVVALWIASALVAVLLFARPHRASAPIVSTLLAIHWAWSALTYHMAFFTSIGSSAASLLGRARRLRASGGWRGTHAVADVSERSRVLSGSRYEPAWLEPRKTAIADPAGARSGLIAPRCGWQEEVEVPDV